MERERGGEGGGGGGGANKQLLSSLLFNIFTQFFPTNLVNLIW